jgi:hypothetical protein
MNRDQVISRYKALVTALGDPAHLVILSAGGALVMMDVREETVDLDVDVSPMTFKWVGMSKPVLLEENVSPRIEYDPFIDLHELSDTTGIVCVDNVWIYSPSEMLKQKRHLAAMPNRKPNKRERDLMEIVQLESLVRSPRLTARMA